MIMERICSLCRRKYKYRSMTAWNTCPECEERERASKSSSSDQDSLIDMYRSTPSTDFTPSDFGSSSNDDSSSSTPDYGGGGESGGGGSSDSW